MASSKSRNITYQKAAAVLEKERVIQLALNNVSCKNIDLRWFDYRFKLTRVTVAKNPPTHSTGFYLTESQVDYILHETHPTPSDPNPVRARNLLRCTIEALDLRTCEKYEVTLVKNHRGEFIFDWHLVCQGIAGLAGLARGQEIAFGVYNFHYIDVDADREQYRFYGVFFATV